MLPVVLQAAAHDQQGVGRKLQFEYLASVADVPELEFAFTSE